MTTAGLLERCAASLQRGTVDDADVVLLRQWNTAAERRARSLAAGLLAAPIRDWDRMVVAHPAYSHQWYDLVRDEITIDEMAAFLLENNHYPAFLTLLERIRAAQLEDDGRRAIDENIADEQVPEPHAQLMRRLMLAVKSRARPDLLLSHSASLIDRTLVFYYGYFCDPAHLVGSVFATERLGTRRVICMGLGLQRLGLSEYELAFTTVHSQCDDHHAGDWLDRVIIPGCAREPTLRARIAKGIAACLETSRDYLDFLKRRVDASRDGGRFGAVSAVQGENR